MTAPEPLMPLLIAAKPGGKPREVLIDEATGERLVADLVIALAGIRAAKAAVLAMTAPDPWDADDGCQACGTRNAATNDGLCDECDQAIGGALDPTPPGEVADATIYCGATAADSAGNVRECQREDDGHILHRNAGDSVTTFTFVWEDAPDAAADSGELPRLTGVPGAMGLGGDAFWAAHPHAAAALANVPGAGLDDPEVCMMVGCGHAEELHSLDLDTGNRLFCEGFAEGSFAPCGCRRYLPPGTLSIAPGESAGLASVATGPSGFVTADAPVLRGAKIGGA